METHFWDCLNDEDGQNLNYVSSENAPEFDLEGGNMLCAYAQNEQEPYVQHFKVSYTVLYSFLLCVNPLPS